MQKEFTTKSLHRGHRGPHLDYGMVGQEERVHGGIGADGHVLKLVIPVKGCLRRLQAQALADQLQEGPKRVFALEGHLHLRAVVDHELQVHHVARFQHMIPLDALHLLLCCLRGLGRRLGPVGPVGLLRGKVCQHLLSRSLLALLFLACCLLLLRKQSSSMRRRLLFCPLLLLLLLQDVRTQLDDVPVNKALRLRRLVGKQHLGPAQKAHGIGPQARALRDGVEEGVQLGALPELDVKSSLQRVHDDELDGLPILGRLLVLGRPLLLRFRAFVLLCLLLLLLGLRQLSDLVLDLLIDTLKPLLLTGPPPLTGLLRLDRPLLAGLR
mmetsp:Transcript_83858/g.195078  ORF Transcript_83858/g.195078 Transcript_83858/m.195078 type:complete len:325 (-) Transcript_83858:239-1213(-)